MSNKKEFNKNYNKLIDELQIKLVHMQDWVIENNKKVVMLERTNLYGGISLFAPFFVK